MNGKDIKTLKQIQAEAVQEIEGMFPDEFGERARELVTDLVEKIIIQTQELLIDDIVHIEAIDDGSTDIMYIERVHAINGYKQFLLKQLRRPTPITNEDNLK